MVSQQGLRSDDPASIAQVVGVAKLRQLIFCYEGRFRQASKLVGKPIVKAGKRVRVLVILPRLLQLPQHVLSRPRRSRQASRAGCLLCDALESCPCLPNGTFR
jgi:hypothetical protein